MKLKWNMLVDSKIVSLSTPEQFLTFSEVYFDSAVRLCSVLARSTQKATYARGTVVLYLTFHATELFLKGAILKKAPREQIGKTHNIEVLNNRYRKLYPGKKYDFEIPFTSEEPDFSGIEPDKVKELRIIIKKFDQQNPRDQRYRYPQNKNGKPWHGVDGFEPSSFLIQLKQLREQFDRISRHILF